MNSFNFCKKVSVVVLALALTLSVTACGKTNQNSEKKNIKVGFLAGPYSDQFKRAVQPILEKKGYKVEIVEFSNAVQPNSSLTDGSIDANVFQHIGYLKGINEKDKSDIVELIKVPTAPLGIYSNKFKKLSELKEGAQVSLSSDASNLARSLVLLQQAGLIKIKPDIDPLKATEKDITENPKKIKIVPLDAPQLPRSLADVDYSIITGNHVIAAGMKLSDSLLLEDPPAIYQIILAVRGADKDKPFAKDLAEAYKSKEFRTFVENDEKAKGFSKPDYWK
ncbi:MetQ/NlpA family ABC transporter substrate-binding protein [Paenibacillus roseipurpureus]|uniref:Lipoprotein n=1 Tax=Paenibacillus roseopurpureus TaxID=2918901 RepID=A0AA96LT51_9BACL|nr:MetQ/NlpA family ABC transporter substrate-binding protein [Paenibacillus sp. MBLB1832]WNR46801.1 MetQ/NlpA family ABC transporter substrate-binding protein [Paenibacillus sp. MBLB1832]